MVDIIDNSEHLHTHDIGKIANHTHENQHDGEGHSGSTILFIFVACLFGGMSMSHQCT